MAKKKNTHVAGTEIAVLADNTTPPAAPQVETTEMTVAAEPEIVSMGEVGGVEQFTTTDGIETAESIPPTEEPTAAELDSAIATLEAQEAALEAQADAEVTDGSSAPEAHPDEPLVDGDDEQVKELAEAMAEITDEEADVMSATTLAEFDDRETFEAAKNPDNTTIYKTLSKCRSKLSIRNAARVLIATNTDPDFINSSIASGSRYNVYAIDKVADLVGALAGGTLKNAINNAVCRSLFRFRAAEEPFTGEMARAAASDKLRVPNAKLRELLIRYTVSASTAPTQASSTMSALQTLGIVRNTGTTQHPVFVLTDTPQTRRLEEQLKAAA